MGELSKKKSFESFDKTYVKNLFKGSDGFYNTNYNEFDVLLVDEAHRLKAKSGMFNNKGNNQIAEIINSSKTTIFFIEPRHNYKQKKIGTRLSKKSAIASVTKNLLYLLILTVWMPIVSKMCGFQNQMGCPWILRAHL